MASAWLVEDDDDLDDVTASHPAVPRLAQTPPATHAAPLSAPPDAANPWADTSTSFHGFIPQESPSLPPSGPLIDLPSRRESIDTSTVDAADLDPWASPSEIAARMAAAAAAAAAAHARNHNGHGHDDDDERSPAIAYSAQPQGQDRLDRGPSLPGALPAHALGAPPVVAARPASGGASGSASPAQESRRYDDAIQRAKDAASTKTSSYLSSLESSLTRGIPLRLRVERLAGAAEVSFTASPKPEMVDHIVKMAERRADIKNPVVRVELRVAVKDPQIINAAKSTLRAHNCEDISVVGAVGGESLTATYSNDEAVRATMGTGQSAARGFLAFASGSSSAGMWGQRTADVYMTTDDLERIRDVRAAFVPKG